MLLKIPFKHVGGSWAWLLPVAWCPEQQQAQGPEPELERAWGRGSGSGGGGTEEAWRGAPRGVQEPGRRKEEGQAGAEEAEWARGSPTGIQRGGSKGAVGRSRSQLEEERSLPVGLQQVSVR